MSHEKANIIFSLEFGKLFTEYTPCFIAVGYRYVRGAVAAEDIITGFYGIPRGALCIHTTISAGGWECD